MAAFLLSTLPSYPVPWWEDVTSVTFLRVTFQEAVQRTIVSGVTYRREAQYGMICVLAASYTRLRCHCFKSSIP